MVTDTGYGIDRGHRTAVNGRNRTISLKLYENIKGVR